MARVSSGNCVLVLGPEIEIGLKDRTSLMAELASEIIQQFQLYEVDDRDDIYHIMQCYLDHGGRRFELAEFLHQFYKRPRPDPPLYDQLATLPFKTILSISHNQYLHNALKNHPKKTPQFGYYNYRKKIPSNFQDPDADHPLVYQLFGSLDHLDSLVLGENDLLLFLQNVVAGTPDLAETLQGVLRDENTSFLFLGFDFSQWYVRILLYVLLGPNRHLSKHNQLPSRVLEHKSFFAHPDSRRVIAYFSSHHTFSFHPCENMDKAIADYIGELEKLYGDRQISASRILPEPSSSPVVFVSYESSHREKVTRLQETLKSAGIRVWKDAFNLRGGDNWEQALQKVIKDVDRFILLETPALVHAEKSVVWQELKQAMERDGETHPDKISRFIIPVILEQCDPIESLRVYHHIDLTKPGGTEALIKSILEDHGENDG